LRPKARLASVAARLSRLLPAFLGGDGTRRYLLALQNLSAPRGTGGFLGEYGILEANHGRISLGSLKPTGTFGKVAPVQAPADVKRLYGGLGALRYLFAANYSPDFPTSAHLIMELWKEKGGPPLDGVIGVYSVWTSELLG